MNWKWLFLSFNGRINRKPFWIYHISLAVLWALYCLILRADFFMKDDKSIPFALIVLWPSLAVEVKRWHDRDKTGWWLLINFVPLIGAIWALIETGFKEGTQGENRFGNDPLEGIARRTASLSNRKLSNKEAVFGILFAIALIVLMVVYATYFMK